MKKIFKSPILWGIIAAVLVFGPQIGKYRFLGTDCTHVAILEGAMEYPGMSPCGLYQFSDGTPQHNVEISSLGLWPWFLNPHWKINFCRHLPSALMALNHKICGLNPLGYPLHSLLWYMALIAVLGLLVIRFTTVPGSKSAHPAAYLTVVIFAFAISHGEALFYGAARWLLMAAFFALGGLVAHLKWREEGWRAGRYISIAGFVVALLCGEAALAALAYLIAYELFGSPGPFKTRLKALLPAALLVVIYLIIYRLLGYGTSGLGLYTNPFNDPLGFIAGLPVKLAAFLGEMFFKLLGIFQVNPMAPGQGLLTIGVGAAALILCGLLFYPVWKQASTGQRRHFRWLIAGTFASMLPFASALPGGRINMIPFIGGSILLALILHHWGRKLRLNLKSPKAWLGGLVCLCFVLIHLILSPYAWFAGADIVKTYFVEQEEFHKKKVLNEIKPHQEAIFLDCGSGGGLGWLYLAFNYRKVNSLPMPKRWWQLSFSSHKHSYLRTAEDTLALEVQGGDEWRSFDVWGLASPGTHLKKGNVVRLSGLQVTILDVKPDGVLRIAFKFEYPLEDERYCFYRFKEGKPEIVKPPEIGQTLTL